MGLQLLYGAALLAASVQAFAFLPQPTDPFQAAPLENGWTPRPTPAPEGHGLFKRQISLPSSYLIAPDNTCGFINGNARSAYACLDDDMQCAFIPSSGKIPGAAGCCKGKDCSFRISCIERSDMDDCDDDCKDNPLTLKCSGLARFCNTVLFPGGVTDYYCSARKQTSALDAETTNNRDRSRTMSTVAPTTTSTTKKSTSTSTTSTTKKSSTTSTSESSSTEVTSETTSETSAEVTSDEPVSATEPPTAATTTDADRSSATTSSTEPVASDSSSTPVGAIVGGILGGIAVIALIIFAAIFLRRQKKKSMAMAELPPPQPFMAEPTYPNTQPPAAPYAQDSASARMSGYAASSAASTPAHMYGAPAATAAGAGVGAGAAAAAAGSFNSYHNHSHNHHHANNNYPDRYANNNSNYNNYPDHHANPNPHNYQDYHHHAASIASTHQPSPLTTPGGSPQPQYAHTPHAPPPLPAPSYYNNSPRQSQDTYRGGSSHGGPGGGGMGMGNASDGAWAGAEAVELPDRRSTSTPVSTYHGVMPVSPASALGPMPGESRGSGNGNGNGNGSNGGSGSGSVGSGVPLILQPGMGYRPYRPPGAGAGAGAGGNAGAGAGSSPTTSPGAGAGASSSAGPGAGAVVGTAVVGSAVAVNVVSVNRNGSVRGMVVPRKAVGGGGSALPPVVQGQQAVQAPGQGQQAQAQAQAQGQQAPDRQTQGAAGGGHHQQTFAVELP